MTTIQIKYPEMVSFLGRNGIFKQSGIQISKWASDKTVMLEPITSKGKVGRAIVGIHQDELMGVIRILMQHVPATTKAKLMQDPTWILA